MEAKTAVSFLLEDNLEECFRILLDYYDKHYLKGLNNREIAKRKDLEDDTNFNPTVKKNQTIKPYIAPSSANQSSTHTNSNNAINPNSQSSNSKKGNIPSFVKEYDTNDKFIKDTHTQDKSLAIGILNNIGDNNSFLSVVIQAFWNLEFIRNFIIYDLNVKESDQNAKLLYNLKSILKKYSHNLKTGTPICIDKLRNSLSEIFQSRRKFLWNNPDDPIDAFYAIINAFHSFHLVNIFFIINIITIL